ncbi:MAG: single-stranded DNA-binding protein [Bacteroidales bacterium]|nr:MAG: single-stranded DNA-binding protein [Bacteroidales bacterium]
MSVNKAILVGYVGTDPEVRYLDSGTAVCNFRLATSEVYKNKNGEKVTTTDWHNVVLWRGLAETAEKYVKKGTQLYIEGRIKTRSWDDKDGNKRYTTEIVCDNFQMLGKKIDVPPEESQKEEKVSSLEEKEENNTEIEEADDLPF